MADSLAKQVARLDPEKQREWLNGLSEEKLLELKRTPWWFIGRPEQQLPDGDWRIWLIQTGRGWGKSRTGAENLVRLILENPKAPDGEPTEWAIFADTFSDCRKVCVEGPSGVIRVLRSYGLQEGPGYTYNRSQWQIRLSTGQIIHMVAADTPDAGRGLNLSGLWADEVAKWRYSKETWNEGISWALRIGKNPKAIITTTPKRVDLIRQWNKDESGSVVVTRGSVLDNQDNLSPAQIQAFRDEYEGTRLWRQEGLGELLEDVPGALWRYEDILLAEPPEFKRIVIAIDPAVTTNEESDETGIVVAAQGVDNLFYVLGDYSCKDTAFGWANRVNELFARYDASLIVYEKNQGGDVFKEVLFKVNNYLPVKDVTAKKNKLLRAEPISTLYEQHKVFHVQHFEKLEDQMLTWEADNPNSPDRLDALVYALSELSKTGAGSRFLSELADTCPSCQQPNTKGAVICNYCYKPMA